MAFYRHGEAVGAGIGRRRSRCVGGGMDGRVRGWARWRGEVAAAKVVEVAGGARWRGRWHVMAVEEEAVTIRW